jgi:hypothetical protein
LDEAREIREVLEENLSRISALSDVLWVATLNPEYLQPSVIIKVSAIIQELADNSIECLGGLESAYIKEAEVLIPDRPAACK